MLRLTLTMRLSMVVLAAVIALWLVLLVRAYRSEETVWTELRPDPAQLAAIVPVLEAVGPQERQAFVAALSRGPLSLSLAAAADSPQGPADGDLTALYGTALPGREVTAERLSLRPLGELLRGAGVRADLAVVTVTLASGETLVAQARRPLLSTRFGVPAGIAAGFLGTLIGLLSLYLMHRELRPLVRLAAAADRIGLSAGAKPIPVPARSAPEIYALVAAFNRLQQRLVTLTRARMALLGGISHDVRTFATRLRLRIESLEGAEHENAIRDIEDMVRMLDDALIASRAGAGDLGAELVDLEELVASEADDRRSLGAPVTFERRPTGEGALVLADRLSLRRILANLVDNALAYGHVARLGLTVDGTSVRLTVDDDGPGIPAEKRALLMEPFVRDEASRNRRTGGAGLGLSVVEALVNAHGGTIEIADAPGGGARFTVRLERFRPDEDADG